MEKKNKQLIANLFVYKWNYSGSGLDGHIIGMYYQKGGFQELYNYMVKEKQRMGAQNFGYYYSDNLIECLKELVDRNITHDDFEEYIFTANNLHFHRNNFTIMKVHGLLKHYKHFDSDFRGEVSDYHQVGEYKIIECKETDNWEFTPFYVVPDFTECYISLDHALCAAIFKKQFRETFDVLLNHVNKKKDGN